MKRISRVVAVAALTFAVLVPTHSSAIAQTSAAPSTAKVVATSQVSDSSTAAAQTMTKAPTAIQGAAAKKKLKAPEHVTVRFGKSGFVIQWSKVKGAKRYQVYAVPGSQTTVVPFRPHNTKKLTLTVPYKQAPISKSGLTFIVGAVGGKVTTRKLLTVDQMNLANGPFVQVGSKNWKPKATSKVNGCIKIGAAAVVATAVAGGVVAGAAAFIPAVGEVTAAGVVAFAAGDGIGAFVGCLLLA